MLEHRKQRIRGHLNKARVIDYEIAGEILEDLARKDTKREAEKLSQDYLVSKNASKNSPEKSIPSSSKTVQIAEEAEIIYYDSEGHSECEVTMGVGSDFEDIDARGDRFLNMSKIDQVSEEVPEMKVDRKGEGKAAEQQDLSEE
jgi:hypothetical protein